MQLVSTNIAGNLHQASNWVNGTGLAEYVFLMDYSGSTTLVVFKVPGPMAPKLRKLFHTLPEHQANPRVAVDFRGLK